MVSSSGIQVHDLDTLGLEQRGKPQCTDFVGNIDYFVFFSIYFQNVRVCTCVMVSSSPKHFHHTPLVRYVVLIC